MRLMIGAGPARWVADRVAALRRHSALLAGIDPAGEPWLREPAHPSDWGRLAADPGRFVGYFDGADRHLDAPPGDLLSATRSASGLWLEYVVAARQPPADNSRFDGPARSFLCSRDFYRQTRERIAQAWRPAFGALRAVLERGDTVIDLRVVPWPGEAEPARAAEAPADLTVTWLIPHRGDAALLDHCLRYVEEELREGDAVWVCFDEDGHPAHAELMAAHPRAHFWRSEPAGLGPYVARHLLGQSATTPLLMFQDSDDLPLRGRRDRLVGTLAASGADMVGSHELRADELRDEVVLFRFPLDVNEATRAAVGHALYHPTSVVRVDAVRRAGGFSTVRRFASDLQFLLRAHFTMVVRNCDGFHYLRRKRPGTLTTAPETALGTPVRAELGRRWRDDFRRVVRGEITLESSSLGVEPHADLERIRLRYLGAREPRRQPVARTTRRL